MTARRESASEPKVVAMGADEIRQMSVSHTHLEDLARDAANATHAEQKMSLWQGLKTYPYAVGWSVFLSTCIVMEGFDKVLINNLYAYGPFQKAFGVQLPDGTYQLTAAWQSAISNAALIGEIMGLLVNGIAAERFGYRKTMIAALAGVIAFIFVVFFAENTVTLLIGQILCGIPWGVFQTITTTYAAEVCPVALRAYLTTYINLCWVIGQLIASSVLRAMLSRSDKWGYKIPFALQWLWPIPIIVGLCYAPESPWWLIRKERRDDAKKALLRLTSSAKDPSFNADETVAMMELTNELEKAHSAGTSYRDCFTRTDLRRTEVVTLTWAIQTLCGACSFMGFSTYFYQQAGMSTEHSFTMSMAQYALGAVGTVSSWALMGWCGRRTLYLAGQAGMFVLLAAIGCLGVVSRTNAAAQWAVGSCLLVYTFVYDATVGPVCYSLVSELSSNRLRAKTVVLARILYNVTGLVSNILTPRMLNPSAWNWGAKTGFFWAASCLLCAVWTYFRLPEPKGRTYAEMDVLFERKVSARKFRTTVVDQFVAGTGSTSSSTVDKQEVKVHVEKVEHA
ncbi:hypothetical protein SLS58_010335 [Diplodia intermedia]|uniref:Major facilitator superfamily (MFS) profile domain-containing protein n=1 Tax=Diplodia intermedia TaxID=856260 RepID=A0ABR3T7K2_9PEZI